MRSIESGVRRFVGVAMCLFLILPAAVMAQGSDVALKSGRGAIAGRVASESGAPLPNAQVFLEGTSFGAVANLQGYYKISNIPAGSYKLVAAYVGYDRESRDVTVGEGSTSGQNFNLKSVVIEGESIVIEGGIRSGQAEALNRQKTSDNIKNVAAEDMIEAFPDPNTAEALQRIPGVSIERDQGEGRYVLIRGMEARLNAMTVNGERLPSPEGDIRSVALDVIPADVLSSIEVIKAITPDMDADAIGGSVNLITKSALDYDKPVIKGSVSGGYNKIVEDGIFKGGITLGNRFGSEKQFGALLSMDYYKSNKGSDNNEFAYTDVELGGSDARVLEDYQLRDYIITRKRFGISSTLDYRPDDRTSLSLRSFFNDFDDHENRRTLRYRPGKGDFETATSATGARAERGLKDRFEQQRIVGVIGTGEHKLDKVNVDYQVSWTWASENEPRAYYSTFQQKKLDLDWSLADADFPQFTVTNGKNLYDNTAWDFSEFSREDNYTRDRDFTAKLNLEHPFSFDGGTGAFKYGVKYRNKDKNRNNQTFIYEWDGDADFTMDQVASSFVGKDFLDNRYNIGQFQDPKQMLAFFGKNFSSFDYLSDDSYLDAKPKDYNATEDILAGFGQVKLDMGKNMLLFGVRVERTSIDYTGYDVEIDENGDYAGTTKIDDTNDFTNLFPMVHYKYSFDQNTNFRAAFTTSLARPNYYSLVPYRSVNREDSEAELGNPALDPTRAINFDLMLEHYVRPLGVISGGFFYKDLKDYIYTSIYRQSGGVYDGYRITQDLNGDNATLWGFELNLQQQLTFLPGALNGLGVYANYTYTDSKAKFPGRTGEDASLPGQAKHIANFALSYEKAGFLGKVSMNMHGKYIDEVGETKADDIFYDNHVQWDISASQRIHPKISIYMDMLNLGNEPLRYYQGVSSRPIQQEYYRWWGDLGIKFDL